MVANLFWVVFGILALIYYAAKEDLLGTIVVVGTVVFCIVGLWLMVELFDRVPWIFYIIFGGFGVGIVIYRIVSKIKEYTRIDNIIFPTDENDPIKMISEFKGIDIGEPEDDLTEDSNPDNGNNSDEK